MKASELFRKKAIENSNNRFEGRVSLIGLPSYNLIIVFIISLILSFITATFLIEFSTYKTVKGMLHNSSGLLRVYPKSRSIITELNVEEGQYVNIGDHLAKFKVNSTKVIGTSPVELEKIKLENQILNLIAKKSALVVSKELEIKKIRIKIRNANAKKEFIQSQIKSLSKQKIIKNRIMVGSEKAYDKGSISQLSLDNAKIDWLKIQESIQRNLYEATELKGLLEQLTHDIDVYRSRFISETSIVDNEILQKGNIKARLDNEIQYSIEATTNGIISNISAIQGEIVNPNHPLFLISSEEAQVVAELYIPSRAIGFVDIGLPVRLRVEAYPHQRYGSVEGVVFEISKSLFFPNEWSNPLNVEIPVYRAKISLKLPFKTPTGVELELYNGLKVSADIILERKTIFDYLISPILDFKNKLI